MLYNSDAMGAFVYLIAAVFTYVAVELLYAWASRLYRLVVFMVVLIAGLLLFNPALLIRVGMVR